MTATEKFLRELIALPSVNPAFLPPNDPRAGEQRVAEFLVAIAAQAGLDVELKAVLPHRSNVFARLSPRGHMRQRVLLAPHLDTVNSPDPVLFVPRRSGDKLFGRGACDTKGSVSAMFSALCELAKSPNRPKATEIIFLGLVDEENGQAGSRSLAAHGLKADLAIVGEPTCLRVVTAHKGNLWLRLETRGKAAHGSRPELGKNAVHAMARVVDLLETNYAAELRKRRHGLLGSPTVNVGAIAGGTQPNIVPDYCSSLVDRRTLPGESERQVWREIQDLLQRKRLRAHLANNRQAECPPLETDPQIPLVAHFLKCVGQRKPVGVDYFCDAAILARGGIPSVVFGPGDIAQAHTINEWISISELDRAKSILLNFLRSLP